MAEFDILAIFKIEGLAELNASFKRLGKEAKQFGRDLNQVGRDASRFGRNLSIGVGIATAGVAESFDEFLEFEDALIGVQKTTSLVGKDLEKLGTDFQKLGEDLAVPAEELLGFAQTAGQLGVDGVEDLSNVAEVIAKLNVATEDFQGEEAATTLARFLEIANEPISNIDELASTIVQLGNTFAATEGEIAATALEIQSAGAALGFTTAESAGLAASFSALNIEPSLAASTISKSFQEIAKAINNGGEELEIFKDLTGLTTAELKQSFEETPVELFQTLLEGMKLLNSEEGALGLTAALQGVNLGARTLGKTLPKLALSSDLVAKGVADANLEFAENNALNEEFEKRAQASSFGLAQLQIAFQNLRVEIGERFGPVSSQIFDALRVAISAITPVVLTFFEEIAASLGEFALSLTEGEDAQQGFIDLANTFIETLKSIGTAIATLIGVAIGLFNALSSLLDIIPGVEGKSAAFLLIFLQMTGGLRLGISTLKLLVSGFKLLEGAFIAAGVISKSGFLGPFLSVMAAAGRAAAAGAAKVIASMVAIGTSMTSLTGIMNLAGIAARTFWAFLTGPIGLALVVGTIIADFIAKFFGFKGIIDAVSQAFVFLLDKVKAVFKAVTDFFGGGEKELKVKVSSDAENDPTGRQGFAGGGYISGAGTSTSDSIPIMASDSEYMINAKSVKKFGVGLFDMLNRGAFPAIQGFASGGLVEALSSSSRINTSSLSPSLATASSSSSGRPLNLILPSGEVIKATTDESTAERLQKNLRRSDSVKSSQLPAWY